MAIRRTGLISLLLATTAVGLAGLEVGANLSAEARLARLLAGHPDLHVASVFAEPLSGRLTLRNVEGNVGAAHIVIGNLRLPLGDRGLRWSDVGFVSSAQASPFDDKDEGKSAPADEPEGKVQLKAPEDAPAVAKPPAAADAGPVSTTKPAVTASGGNAVAENIAVTVGGATYKIKRIEFAGTTLSSDDIATILDPASADSAEARLRKLNAATITIPEVTGEQSSNGTEAHFAIQSIVLNGVTGGKATSIKVGPATILAKSADDEITIDSTGFDGSGFDFAQSVHFVASVRTDDSEPLKGIYDAVSVNGIKVGSTKKHWAFTIASVKETGVRGRPLKTDFLKNPPKDKLTDEQQKAVFNDMAHSLAVGTVEMSDVSGHGAEVDKGTFTLANFSMRDFGEGKFGGFGFRDMRFASPEVTFSVASFNAGPFSFAQDGTLTPQATSIDFNTIAVQTTSPKANVSLAHIGVGGIGGANELPSSAKLVVDNLAFDLTPDMAQAQPLMDMGYKRLDLSAGLASTYDSDKQVLTIKDLTFNGVEMGNIALGLGLSNVSKNVVSTNTELAKAAMLAVLVQSLNFDVKNAGLVDRALAWKAKADNVPVDQFKANLATLAATQIAAAAKNHPNAKLVGDAVAAFIRDPKTLHIAILAKTGLGAASMGMLDDPSVLLDTLDVKASANQ